MSTAHPRNHPNSLANIYDCNKFNRPPEPIVMTQHKDNLDNQFMMQPMNLSKSPSSTYIINVSGQKFEVGAQTFYKMEPILTLSCDSMATSSAGKTEYFLERQPQSFALILDYFQNGELHMPSDICPSVYKRELDFWGVDWRLMNQCCLRRFIGFHQNEETLTEFDQQFVNRPHQPSASKLSEPSRWERIRVRGWAILDDPRSSFWAKLYLAVASTFVILSIFVLAASTHTAFTRGLTAEEWEMYMTEEELHQYWDLIHPTKPRPRPRSEPNKTSAKTPEEGLTTDVTTASQLQNHVGKRSVEEELDVGESFEYVSSDSDITSKINQNPGQIFEHLIKDPKLFLKLKPGSQDLLQVIGDKQNGKFDNLISSLPDKTKKAILRLSYPKIFQREATGQKISNAKTSLQKITSSSQRELGSGNEDEENSENLDLYNGPLDSDGSDFHRRYKRSTVNITVSNRTISAGSKDCIQMSGYELGSLLALFQAEATSQSTSQLPTDVFAMKDWLASLEMVCIVYFTIEFILRLIFAPARLRYLWSFFTLVDVVSIVSMYTVWMIGYFNAREKYSSSYIDALNCFQIARIFRFFRIVKNVIGFKVLVFSVRSSWKELMLLILYIVMAVTTFSSLVYFCERDNMQSIPDAAWWVIVTMTTVGYGDITPYTMLGKLVGVACALSGVLLIAVTVPIFVNNFLLFYDHSKIHDSKEYKLKEQKDSTSDETGTTQSFSNVSSFDRKSEDGNSTPDKFAFEGKVVDDVFDYKLPRKSSKMRTSSCSSKTASVTKVRPIINSVDQSQPKH